MSTGDDVRGASEKFYAALNRLTLGDASGLADIWSRSETVTTMHPIGGEQVGWTAVKESFEQVAGLASDGHVELADRVIHSGAELAYELGIERGSSRLPERRSTSISVSRTSTEVRRAGGRSSITTRTSPAMLDVLARLQAA